MAFPLVGALIASKRPENAVGWLCLAVGLMWTLGGLLERTNCLVQSNGSPLLDAVWKLACEALEQNETAVLLVKDQRLAAASEAVLETDADLRDVKVVVPAQMRGGMRHGRTIAVGSDRWFPEHVFSAPRARVEHSPGGRGWFPDLIGQFPQEVFASLRD